MTVWPYLLVGVLATYLWRGLGVLLSGRINADSALLRWFTAVAYAMLAGLIARLIILPAGPLAHVALWERGLAAVTALAVYLLTRRNIIFGVAAGTATLILCLQF
ncbi:MAG TPA: AzlD domain-containing protein [Terriglobales bacterium]|jgi:branched-subunit amino acid transport protein|nr:AzlD domain-containing protein [Terriglobales bacterium]